MAAWDSKVAEWHDAIQRGDSRAIGRLLGESPALLDEVDGGYNALSFAAEKGHTRVVEKLLAAKANLKAIRPNGLNALHLAASNGHRKVVAQLLAASPELVDSKDVEDWTALHYAASGGHDKVVTQLLAARPGLAGAVTSSTGWLPVHHAAYHRHEKVAGMFLVAKPEIIFVTDKRGDTLLHVATERCSLKFVQKVWQLNPAALHVANNHSDTPFRIAIRYDRMDLVSLLQGRLAFDDIVASFTACKRRYLAHLRPVMEKHCKSLSLYLHRDVIGTVYEYLGFECLRNTPKQ